MIFLYHLYFVFSLFVFLQLIYANLKLKFFLFIIHLHTHISFLNFSFLDYSIYMIRRMNIFKYRIHECEYLRILTIKISTFSIFNIISDIALNI